MAESDSGEKTEEATQQRRDDFRKRGQVAQTRELSSVFLLFGTALAIWALGRFFLLQVSEIFTQSITEFVVTAARSGEYVPAVLFVLKKTAFILLPIFGLLGLLAFASTVLQVGFLTNEEAMQPKFEKLNPVEGLKRIFSIRSFVEGMKALVKVILIGGLAFLIIRGEASTVPFLVQFNIEQLFSYMGDVLLKLLGSIGLFMALLAGFDYFFQRWDLEQKMRMTKQEVKEELKSREGDPLIKARIRRTQREMAQKRMMNDVPSADVIVTNPTHIAVALKYDMSSMAAPKIVAMGAGVVAEKIKELARENSVPIVENKPLARTIYKTLKIGQTIPRELFTAVAEILSYVYRIKRKVLN